MAALEVVALYASGLPCTQNPGAREAHRGVGGLLTRAYRAQGRKTLVPWCAGAPPSASPRHTWVRPTRVVARLPADKKLSLRGTHIRR